MKRKTYTYEELEALSLSELQGVRKVKMAELHDLRMEKHTVIANILSIQGTINLELANKGATDGD